MTYIISLVVSLLDVDITNHNFTQEQYYIFFYKAVAPILERTGTDMLFSLLFAGASPYILVIFLRIRGTAAERNQKKFNKF